MRPAWLLLGLAVAVPVGFVLVTRQAPALPQPKSTAAPELTPSLTATLKQWLDDLDVDHATEPGHKIPSSETVAGATVFASQLQAAGYVTEADALRGAIALASGQPPPAADQVMHAMNQPGSQT